MTVSASVAPGFPHHIIPDGCVSLVAARPERGPARAALLGPRAEALVVPLMPGDRYWGVRFWPDAAGAVLALDVRELAGRVVAPLTSPAWAADLLAALARCATQDDVRAAARALEQPVRDAPPLDDVVRAVIVATVASRGEMSVAELARGAGIGTRQLERRFAAAVGLTPKQFGRIRRMRAALSHLLDPAPRTWSEVAADLGFADHSHLVRDAVDLSGLTPSALAGRVRSIRHGTVRP